MEDLLYLVGETLEMELDCVESVTYPKNLAPNELLVTVKGGKTYVLSIKEQ